MGKNPTILLKAFLDLEDLAVVFAAYGPDHDRAKFGI